MPTPAKTAENMSKHLTAAERLAREDAEQSIMPERANVDLKKPKFMAKNAAACRYWKSILDRMSGLAILDNLDSESLGLYCVMLARHESMQATRKTLGSTPPPDATAKQLLDFIGAINTLESKQQALERNLLVFADKLGLTPSSRARLASRRAEVEADNDPDSYLFG